MGKIRAGGLGPEAVEDVRVSLGKGRGEKVRVGDVASVVVRGRNVGVLVGEKEVCLLLLTVSFNSPCPPFSFPIVVLLLYTISVFSSEKTLQLPNLVFGIEL